MNTPEEFGLGPGSEAPAVDAGSRYIVIGYGETDNPQAAFANKREELLDAVLGMMYTHPSDADAEIREAYRKDLDDEDEWTNDGIWRTEFEIGGIVIYDTGERVGNSAALSASTEAAADLAIARDATVRGEVAFQIQQRNRFLDMPTTRAIVDSAFDAAVAKNTLPGASTEAAAGEPGITGPLRDDQRQRAISLYMSLPHSWESAESVITMVSASAYANGAHDAAPLRDEIRDHLNTAPPAASGQKLTDEQIAALRVAADALIERYAEPIRAILRNAERVDGLTVQGLRTLMMRHAKSYSEWDCGSLERVDFGQYGFDEFARALLRASSATASDKEGA